MPRLKVSSVIFPLRAGVLSCETFVIQQIPPASCQIRRHVPAAARAPKSLRCICFVACVITQVAAISAFWNILKRKRPIKLERLLQMKWLLKFLCLDGKGTPVKLNGLSGKKKIKHGGRWRGRPLTCTVTHTCGPIVASRRSAATFLSERVWVERVAVTFRWVYTLLKFKNANFLNVF